MSRLQDEPRTAADHLAEALELPDLSSPTRSSLYVEQARLALEGDRFEEAEQALAKAQEALKGSDNLVNLANVITEHAELEVRRGRPAESLRRVEEALELAGEAAAPDLNLEAHALYLKSVALWKLGDAPRSRRTADAALALLEETRNAWQDLGLYYLANRQAYYRHRLDLATATESPENAWKVFEGYRAQGLLQSVSRRVRLDSEGPGATDPEELETRRAELLAAVREVDALRPAARDGRVDSVMARFRELRLALRELQADQWLGAEESRHPEIGPVTAAEMLDGETLALVFAAGTESFYILALGRPGGLRLQALDAEVRRLGDRVGEVVEGLDPYGSSRARRELDRNVRELSDALLGPLADRLDGFRRLMIVADGALERLPFEILRHPRRGRPIVATHEVAYLPSFSVLAATRGRICAAPESRLFALGDPIFGSHDERWTDAADPRSADEALVFRRLPASAAEVEGIARLYAEDVTAVLGGAATRERFLAEAPKHRVLHVASHARSDQQAPERSRIALSCLDAESRVPETCDLYFEDVAALDLCGQVVVLSACDTAGGQPVAGEGILGLPWAFLRAGAASVVASRWRVADEPTAQLMTAFHRHLRGGAGPAAALRQAKLELIEAGRPPSDWAAFVLLGDWRSTSPSSTFSSPSGPME